MAPPPWEITRLRPGKSRKTSDASRLGIAIVSSTIKWRL